jgi:hypothetical protein
MTTMSRIFHILSNDLCSQIHQGFRIYQRLLLLLHDVLQLELVVMIFYRAGVSWIDSPSARSLLLCSTS